jgi:bifunctional non-homologous end joining protein LigD
VTPGLSLADYTIRTVPQRMETLRSDPMRPVLAEKPDLLEALQRLHERLEG